MMMMITTKILCVCVIIHSVYGCFGPDTLVRMRKRGVSKKMKDLKINDRTKGGKVFGVYQFSPSEGDIYDYDGVYVFGEHKVREDGVFMRVDKSKRARRVNDTNISFKVLYDIDVSKRRIYTSNGVVWADYSEVLPIDEVERIELEELNRGVSDEERQKSIEQFKKWSKQHDEL